MKLITGNLPRSNYESDKPKKESKRSSAMKVQPDSLHKINEESEYDEPKARGMRLQKAS